MMGEPWVDDGETLVERWLNDRLNMVKPWLSDGQTADDGSMMVMVNDG